VFVFHKKLLGFGGEGQSGTEAGGRMITDSLGCGGRENRAKIEAVPHLPEKSTWVPGDESKEDPEDKACG